MNRVARIEAQLFNEAPLRAVDPEVGIGKLFRLDCAHGGNAFGKLLRYETAIDRGIQRAYKLLATVQAARRAGDEEEWEDALPAVPGAVGRDAPPAPPPPQGTGSGRGNGTNGNLRKEPNRTPGRRSAGGEPHPTPAPGGAPERELDLILGPPALWEG
jgi:hypothetical protein